MFVPDTPAAPASGGDLFNDFMSAPPATQLPAANGTAPATSVQNGVTSVSQPSQDSPSSAQPATSTASDDVSSLFTEGGGGTEPTKNTKESILALYGNASQQQQMYGVPGQSTNS